MRQNCWEFHQCGREPQGVNVHALGVCPASADLRADGLNGGKNGGRACWAVAGTMCRGTVQGTVAMKLKDCAVCDFSQKVREEEQGSFAPLKTIYKKLVSNCWDHHRCGREQGGSKVHDLGVCPAAVEAGADGMHDGINGGRVCWAVAGTFCRGEVQGSFASKIRDCLNCEFYESIRMEQGEFFIPLQKIMDRVGQSA